MAAYSLFYVFPLWVNTLVIFVIRWSLSKLAFAPVSGTERFGLTVNPVVAVWC